ncbi:RSP_7527 family protein [Silicimonas algicola]|uniref:Uncharacterized protein n=1 Tax=Silicimonas algicola TaxID=1826607 RepID=A0A316GBV7_9RHOB|nr:hypothetical protein C8D95_102342 [Silicimonas algicola]
MTSTSDTRIDVDRIERKARLLRAQYLSGLFRRRR